MLKECKHHGSTEHKLRKDSGTWRCKKCIVDAVTRRRRKLKIMAVEYKGGKCGKCGYSRCVDALDFHHTDQNTKEFSISHTGVTRSWEIIKVELDKCELLCANCHREAHSICTDS